MKQSDLMTISKVTVALDHPEMIQPAKMFLCYTFLSLVPAFLIVYSLKITWMDRQGLTHLFTTQISVLVSA